MKKTLVAVAVLGSFTAFAVAESNVTLYGLIDESILVTKGGSGPTNAQIASGFTAGSRWGIRGVEDLGGGNKVGFILEQGFNIDTGNAGGSRAFHRESALYVAGDWGQLTVGRLGSLGYAQSTNILKGAIFGTTYGPSGWDSASQNQNLSFSRVDNAIAYKTASYGGFSVHAMYSNKVDGSNIDDSGQKWSLNNHYYGLGVLYNGGDLQGSIIFEAEDNKDGTWKGEGGQYHLTLGGQWKLGMVTPYAIYQYQWGVFTQHGAQIGAAVDCAGGTFMLAGRYVTRSGDHVTFGEDRDNANVWNVGVAYAYPLSKRTKTYAYAGYTDGGKAWGSGSYKTNYMFNGFAVGVGLAHSF